MKHLAQLLALALALSACDGASLTAVENASELSDTAVLGAKPTKVLIDEVSSSGWSGKASCSRSSQGGLTYRITAYGEPNVTVALCISTSSGTRCSNVTTSKMGKASVYNTQNVASGASGRFQIKNTSGATVYAESALVVLP